jgi:hypothetical protein
MKMQGAGEGMEHQTEGAESAKVLGLKTKSEPMCGWTAVK